MPRLTKLILKVTLTSVLQSVNVSHMGNTAANMPVGSGETALVAVAAIAPQTDLPPTRKGQATREKLLVAAERVFGALGYEAARIADIVAEANVSHGLFYRHFADKDAVLFAVLTRLNDRLRHTSGRTAGETAVPTLAQLEARNILFFREYAEHRQLFRVSREAAARVADTGFRTLWLGIRSRFVERTRRWIGELEAGGHIALQPDADMLAEGLSALTEQMAYVQVGLAENDPDEATIERLGKACGLIWYRSIFGGVA
jgi:AcrR family transcriptional regulator